MKKEPDQAATSETFDPQIWWETVKHRWPVLVRHIVETAAQKNCLIKLCCTMPNAEGYPTRFTIYWGTAMQVPAELQNRRVEFWETEGNTLLLVIPTLELTDEEINVLRYFG